MIDRSRLSPLLVALCVSSAVVSAQNDREALARKLDQPFRAAYPDGEPGAAVIITKGGETVFRRGYGMASVELGVAIDPSQTFCLASVTKPFTAMAVLALVEDGRLSLADRASQHLPELELDERITIEQLLNHTAGLPDFTSLPAFDHSHIHERIAPAELCLAAKGQTPTFEPGSAYDYRNVHYALLARIVERASGKPWQQFLAERIFTSAGMTHTVDGGHDQIVPGLVSAYEANGDGWRRARALSLTRGYGLGGLCSTVDDLARWHVAFRDGKILEPATIERMQTPPVLADGSTSTYALGWVVRNVRGHEVVFHAGGIYGWAAMLVRIPKHDVFVAVLSNRDTEDNPIMRLAVGAAALVASQ